MSARITAQDVFITRRDPQPTGGLVIEARVRGRQRTFSVDLNPAWGNAWMCSCGMAPRCAHIRAVRELVKL